MLTDKAPYAVTLLIAVIAWAFTHAVDRLQAIPFLLYDFNVLESSNNEFSTYLTLKNISRNRVFRQIEILITASSNDTFVDAAVIPYQPASEGDQPWTVSGRTFNFRFPEIQPGGTFGISLVHLSPTPPAIRLSSDSESFYAVRPNIETFLIQNEFNILFGGIVISAILLGWIVKLTKARRRR
jgi:hypothetical protein